MSFHAKKTKIPSTGLHYRINVAVFQYYPVDEKSQSISISKSGKKNLINGYLGYMVSLGLVRGISAFDILTLS